jgi:hypothetical protein
VVALVGGVLVLATTPAAADTAQVDYTCDLPGGVTGIFAGEIPDTVPVDDLDVTLVDTPDPVVAGQPVHFDIEYPVLDPSEGLPPAPPALGGYGLVRFKFIELTAPIPAGLSQVTAAFESGSPSWASISVVGSNIRVRIQSPVPGSYILVNPDVTPAVITIEDSPGHRIPLDTVPAVDIDAIASGAPGTAVQWRPPTLLTQIKYTKDLGVFLRVNWNDANLPCTPNDPNQVVASTVIAPPEPVFALAMAPIEAAVAPGDTIHYALGLANQTGEDVTGLAVVPGDLTCPGLPATLADGTALPVACTHVARSWELGTYTADIELTSDQIPSLTATAAGVQVAIPPHGFADVAPTAFFDAGVDYAKFFGLVRGFPGNRYEPGDPVNRGQIVNMLWQLMGRPGGSPAHGFADVPPNAFYRQGLSWAKAEGLVRGFPRNRYLPLDPVNRCQLANMVWNMVGALTGSPASGYTDAIPVFCRPAVDWARAQGLVTAFAGGVRFRAGRAASRGEVAYLLHRLALTEAAWSAAPTIPPPVLFDPTD